MSRALKVLGLLLVLVGAATWASAASAEVPIRVFGLLPSTTQAGSHPDIQFAVSVESAGIQQEQTGHQSECDCENPRFVVVHAPTGLVGNAHATPRCTAADFAVASCPVNSQIGIVSTVLNFGFITLPAQFPIYNLEPRTNDPGLLGVNALGAKFYYLITGRTGSDYGLDTKVTLTNGLPVSIINNSLWGVPASPVNDSARFHYQAFGSLLTELCDANGMVITPNLLDPEAAPNGPSHGLYSCNLLFGNPEPSNFGEKTSTKSTAPEIPFTENATTCGVPLTSSVDIIGYDGSAQSASAPFPAATGCDSLDFNPALAAKPTTTETDSPSGLDVDLTVPQPQSAKSPSPSEIRSTTITLPEGFTINSNAADGKVACADLEAQIGINSEAEAKCPEFAKIGTLQITTSLLPGPLDGYVYLGAPQPGNRYRVFLTADGFNTHVKLAGEVHPDPVTGQLVISFDELPQSPFSEFRLHIFGAERGILATPTRCGTYAVHTQFVPWDSILPDQDATQFFRIDSGPDGSPCPGPKRPFQPSFEGGSAGNTAGSYSPFSVRLTRHDGEQFIAGLSVSAPLGFAAKLKGVPYCPQSQINRLTSPGYSGIAEMQVPACPPASQIGTVQASAGAGSRPLNVQGRAYLAGPYRGAPLSLVVVVPAVSGPYDLGDIAVRAAIHVDPVTARVTTVSDPLPQILEGITLRTKSLRVNIDRTDFALNPTNCEPLSIDAIADGDEATAAGLSAPFQVANCAALPFRPKLGLRLRGSAKRLGHPAVRAVLRQESGEANLRRTVVAMPHALLLEQSHLKNICTRVQFAAEACPSESVYGHATLETPILEHPLTGNVYLRASDNPLPDLVVALRGQVSVDLDGRIDTTKAGGLRTTFGATPDVPFSKFVLDLAGGDKGLLVNSASLCKSRPRARTLLAGQNGRRRRRATRLKLSCHKAHQKRSGRHHRAGKAK
jgi:hypothetical protein